MNNEVIEVLISYGVDRVELKPPFNTPSGNITSVDQDGFTYSNEMSGEYSELDFRQLEDIAYHVEQELLSRDSYDFMSNDSFE